MNNEKLVTFYPGVYTPEEEAAIQRYRNGETPLMFEGLQRVPPMDDWTVRLFAKCWNPYDPLFSDPAYAKEAGYEDVPAMPGYLSIEVRGTFPKELGTVSRPDGTSYIGDGYDHEDLYYRPIYPGEKLTMGPIKRDFYDATPAEGSTKRILIMINECDVFDEKGEVVAKCIRRWPEALKKSLDPNVSQRELEGGPGGPPTPGKKGGKPGPMPGGPGMGYTHPQHIYTDEDYETMKTYWKNEKIRGSETLYWEDVNIGDEPIPTCEPPQYGGTIVRNMAFWDLLRFNDGGLREELLRGGGRSVRNEQGLYELPMTSRHLGLGEMASLYNYHGKLLATRCLTNWCGDKGFVTRFGWRFVNDAEPEKQFNHFPAEYFRPTELLKVPYMKDRFANSHGMGYDAYITRGYVYDKYIGEDGGHYVDLILWVEDFDGNIEQECPATVRLPSRTA